LTPALVSLAGSLSEIVGWFASLPSGTKDAIVAFIGIVAVVGPVLKVIGDLITFIGGLQLAWGTVVTFFTTGAGAAFGTTVAAIFGAITAPVWLLIGAVVLLGVTIAVFGKDAWNTIQTIGKIFEALWLLIRIKIDQIKTAFTSVDWSAIGENMMQGVVNGIQAGWNWVVNAARSVAQAAFEAARQALWSHSPSLKFQLLGQNMMQGLANGIDKNAGIPVSATSKAVNATVPAAANAGSSGGMGGATLVYSPMISLASQAEAETVLLPMLRKLQRQVG
jgi:phage-related minor tail protein